MLYNFRYLITLRDIYQIVYVFCFDWVQFHINNITIILNIIFYFHASNRKENLSVAIHFWELECSE